MAEGKLKEYSRESSYKQLIEYINRAKNINKGDIPFERLVKVNNLIVFGSFVNSKKEKVHDVDLLLDLERLYDEDISVFDVDEKAPKLANYFEKKINSLSNNIVSMHNVPIKCIISYLKANLNIISAHGYDDKEFLDEILNDKHLFIIKNGKVLDNNINKLKEFINLEEYERKDISSVYIKEQDNYNDYLSNSDYKQLIKQLRANKFIDNELLDYFYDHKLIERIYEDGDDVFKTKRYERIDNSFNEELFIKTLKLDLALENHLNNNRYSVKDIINLFKANKYQRKYFYIKENDIPFKDDRIYWIRNGKTKLAEYSLTSSINVPIKLKNKDYHSDLAFQYWYDIDKHQYSMRVTLDNCDSFEKSKNHTIFNINPDNSHTDNINDLFEMSEQIIKIIENEFDKEKNVKTINSREMIEKLSFSNVSNNEKIILDVENLLKDDNDLSFVKENDNEKQL